MFESGQLELRFLKQCFLNPCSEFMLNKRNPSIDAFLPIIREYQDEREPMKYGKEQVCQNQNGNQHWLQSWTQQIFGKKEKYHIG